MMNHGKRGAGLGKGWVVTGGEAATLRMCRAIAHIIGAWRLKMGGECTHVVHNRSSMAI